MPSDIDALLEDIDKLADDGSVPPEETEEEEPKVEETEVEEEEVEESEEEEEETEEEVEVEDDEEPLESYADTVDTAKLEKKYPDIYKDFPQLKKVVAREAKYAEIFPTLEDAENSVNQIRAFKALESSIFSGDLTQTLNEVKKADPKAFAKITDDYLGQLAKVDNPTYLKTVSKVLKNALAYAHHAGKANNDEQLQIAAELLHKFVYNTPEITLPEAPKTEEVDDKSRNEQLELRKQLLINTTEEVGTRVNSSIRNLVEKTIDPKDQMSSYIKAKAIDDVMDGINQRLAENKRFRAIVDKLWEASINENYSERSKIKIRNAIINKAKEFLPVVISGVRSEALKGSGARTRKASEKPLPRQKAAGSSNRSSKEGKEIPKGMRTIDYLMED